MSSERPSLPVATRDDAATPGVGDAPADAGAVAEAPVASSASVGGDRGAPRAAEAVERLRDAAASAPPTEPSVGEHSVREDRGDGDANERSPVHGTLAALGGASGGVDGAPEPGRARNRRARGTSADPATSGKAERPGRRTAGRAASTDAPREGKRAVRRDGIKVYLRKRARGSYYYGDLRAYADVGGGLEALKAPGASRATSNFAEAAALYAAREAFYRERRAQVTAGTLVAGEEATSSSAESAAPVRLGPFLRDHLAWKAARPHVRTGTIARDEKSAKVLLRCLGNLPLSEVTPARLEAYVEQRSNEPGIRRGTRAAPRSIRAELHTLSHAMRRAVMLGLLPSNPVRLMMSKPPVPTEEAVYLTDGEAARLLEAAREEDAHTAVLRDTLADKRAARAAAEAERERRFAETGHRGPGRPRRVRPASTPSAAVATIDDRVPFAHAIVATYLYTGGRAEEVLGLRVSDVDFVRKRVYFRHNAWRKLKRDHHDRGVELWPALADVLRAHVTATGLSGDDLLFPSPATGGMLDRFGKPLARCLERAALSEQHTGQRITCHSLRHTFATALLQTLVPIADGGWAVRSSFDVAKQLGHRSSKLVDDTYGHAVDAPSYRRELRYGRESVAAPHDGTRHECGPGL